MKNTVIVLMGLITFTAVSAEQELIEHNRLLNLGLQALQRYDEAVNKMRSKEGQLFTVKNNESSGLKTLLVPWFSTQCPVCQKTYKQPSYLRLHISSHMPRGPFMCGVDECKSFPKRRNDLLAHLRLTHKCPLPLLTHKKGKHNPYLKKIKLNKANVQVDPEINPTQDELPTTPFIAYSQELFTRVEQPSE